MKLLIVDDDSTIRFALSGLLMSLGYTIVQADCLAAARRIITNEVATIDLVISDINLGDGNSPELHRDVRDLLAKHDTAWVTITASYGPSAQKSYYHDLGIPVVDKDAEEVVRAMELALSHRLYPA